MIKTYNLIPNPNLTSFLSFDNLGESSKSIKANINVQPKLDKKRQNSKEKTIPTHQDTKKHGKNPGDVISQS
jgi:hypothetical protein